MITDRAPDLTLARTNEEKFQLLLDAYTRLRRELENGLQTIDERNMTLKYKKRVEDTEGNVSQIIHDAQQLTLRVSNAEGDISSLELRAGSIESRVSNAEGDISTIKQAAGQIELRVSDAEGNISTLTQTAQGLNTRVTNAEGSISTLTQTASGLTTRVSNAEGSISTLTQTAGSLTTRITSAEGSISTLAQTAAGLQTAVSDKISRTTATQTSTSFSLMVSNGVGNTGMVVDASGLLVQNGRIAIRAGGMDVFYADTSGNVSLRGSIQAGSTIYGTTIQGSSVIGGEVATNLPGYDRLMMTGATLTAYAGGYPHGPQLAAGQGSIAALNFFNGGNMAFALNYQQDYVDGVYKVFMRSMGALKLEAGGNMSLGAAGQIYVMSDMRMDSSDVKDYTGRIKYVKNNAGGNMELNYDGASLRVFINGQSVGGAVLT